MIYAEKTGVSLNIQAVVDPELKKFIQALPVRLMNKAVRRALEKTAGQALARAQKTAPVQIADKPGGQVGKPGTLRRTMFIGKVRQRKAGAFIGVFTGRRQDMGISDDDDYYYPASVEFGYTRGRRERKKLAHKAAWTDYKINRAAGMSWREAVGVRKNLARRLVAEAERGAEKIPGRHYMQKALAAMPEDMMTNITDEVQREIKKMNAELERARKRAERQAKREQAAKARQNRASARAAKQEARAKASEQRAQKAAAREKAKAEKARQPKKPTVAEKIMERYRKKLYKQLNRNKKP